MLKHITTDLLNIAYDEQGEPDGWPVILLHGFPYDVHAYEHVAPRLAAQGARVLIPFLRGYGPTRFRSSATLRSGQQAALGADLLALLDVLGIEQAIIGGYDWGGRAACIVAALWPARTRGLVSVNGYNIQNIAAASRPADPEKEHRLWYQYYVHGERGRTGLEDNRRAFCRLLWTQWSPIWCFDDATFARSAAAFDNPDFVDVVVHSYRHRFGLVDGDPRYDDIERRLSVLPPIAVPTITLEGETDGVSPPGGRLTNATRFTGRHENRVVANAGHNLPQEAPDAFAEAILDIHAWTA
ncbi:alpha/beta hydrolase [Caballeronia sp. LZ035]|uniref:alpha/beta fold hydrolase n=1 Tax=Caballeronia sp. LZ035 TaxID=3038568 RepID=UPI00285D70CE|nr:alpha/beta hydrolase [Caballeronia sp. LZ035]MDR5760589.1 alpha/beta hydrolase [Caballeronia sp. LZ035]